MKNLANKEIKVVNAVTNVNTTSKSSFLTGETIKLGPLLYKREDGAFYSTTIDGVVYQVFHRFINNTFWIDKHDSSRSKTITVKEWAINEDLKGHVEIINLPNSESIGVLCFDDNQDGYLNYVLRFQAQEVDTDTHNAELKAIEKEAREFCDAHGVNLMMY